MAKKGIKKVVVKIPKTKTRNIVKKPKVTKSVTYRTTTTKTISSKKK
jgi:hypothetical protein